MSGHRRLQWAAALATTFLIWIQALADAVLIKGVLKAQGTGHLRRIRSTERVRVYHIATPAEALELEGPRDGAISRFRIVDVPLGSTVYVCSSQPATTPHRLPQVASLYLTP